MGERLGCVRPWFKLRFEDGEEDEAGEDMVEIEQESCLNVVGVGVVVHNEFTS